ncbi:hypothetical protein [Pseudoalteromonas sp. B530]|uniref:M61 family metallopeptidase n=1 Tax=Pseudoalteromonas sp. B530 TaxID=2994390 RepID=UPI00224B04B3|nr:hypothetical protein [Pseudoalteromonas sp. B530]MCX2766240.1 hypothetical protein [Pseudoalteromonas sp. B530]
MFKTIAVTLSFAFYSLLFSPPALADHYTVFITKNNPRIAKVKAVLFPHGHVISMNEQNVHGLKNGWGGFVRNLTVLNSDGETIQISEVENSKWELIGYENGKITLSYDVVLGHDTVIPKIKFGDNGAAYATEDGVMWAGRALFIAGKPSKKVNIKFETPNSWAITTPWESVNDSTTEFYVEGTSDLQNSAFFAGEHTQGSFKVGNVQLRTAFSGEYTRKMVDDINQKVDQFFQYYGAQYQSPLKSRMVLIVSDRNDGGGEVMGKAISISVGPADKKLLDKSSKIPLGISRLVAHELFHGFAFNQLEVDDKGGKSALYEWFNEGFGAEYASQLALLRIGIKNESEFLDGILYRMKEYEAEADGKLTLISAGADKSDKSTTVYWGGMIAALTLDFKIRAKSEGRRNLDELWRYLLQNYPRGGKEMNLNELYKSVSKLYGESIALEFKDYVTVPNVIPFYDAAKLMGLKYNGRKLIRDSLATKSQKLLWEEFVLGKGSSL